MLQHQFNIAGQVVGGDAKPYVIAEAGSNFNQNLDTAYKLIDAAVEARAAAVKFQLFSADALYPEGGELYELFKSIELNPDWVPKLVTHASDRGIQFLASAFDKHSIEVLDAVDMPAYKIASSETENLKLIHYIASKGKPLIISTGMCDMVDVEEAVNVCLSIGNKQVVLLQCGAMYPLPVELANLRVISTFAKRFNCPVGYSDHTLGQASAVTALGLGATVFEKHFTLDRQSKGPDHSYALEPNELKAYIDALSEGHLALGNPIKEMLPKEREVGRREGLHVSRDISVGETLSLSDVEVRRPAIGLRARYVSSIVGAYTTKALAKGEPITWESIQW